MIFAASNDLEPSREHPRVPGPSLWPVGLALGIVVLLVGLVVPSWILVAFGAVMAVLFALLWVRDRGAAAGLDKAGDVEPERREAPVAAAAEEDEYVVLSHDASYPREKFLEASTLGLGAVIGVLINVPVIGFALLPAFLDQGHDDHDIGPLDLYPEGKWRIVTFPTDPEVGDVSRHTVFVRYNGQVEGLPSFTVLSSHCVHLGCPVQPNGLPEDEPVKYHDVTLLGTDAVGLRLPVPRRPVRQRGQPHGRPARPRARPDALLGAQRQPLRRRVLLGVDRRGHRRRRLDQQVELRVPGRPRRRSPVLALPDPAAQLMAAPMTTRDRILYPVDWLEERSGLVGGVKYFLFRKVPGDVNWFQTLGSATLTAFIVQAVTGVILAMYYKPTSDEAYSSIQYITNDLWAGWLVRGMHRWGASCFIILMFLHMGRVFLFGAYKYPRELNWLIGVGLLMLGLVEGFTGYLLPWDQTAYWATTVGININATAPFIGPFLAQFLQGGSAINEDTLPRFYAIHMLVLPGGLIALITLHLYLVIRLGVTSPPWSREAAGNGSMVKAEEPGGARDGLTRPSPRGDGNGNGDHRA